MSELRRKEGESIEDWCSRTLDDPNCVVTFTSGTVLELILRINLLKISLRSVRDIVERTFRETLHEQG